MPPTSLAGGDLSGVCAAENAAALPSGNAANVVARVGVSHVAVVVAVFYNGGIQPGNAAEIRDINDGFLIPE